MKLFFEILLYLFFNLKILLLIGLPLDSSKNQEKKSVSHKRKMYVKLCKGSVASEGEKEESKGIRKLSLLKNISSLSANNSGLNLNQTNSSANSSMKINQNSRYSSDRKVVLNGRF